jgi:hypothetical protein
MNKQRAGKLLEMTKRLIKINEAVLSTKQLKEHRRMIEAIRSELKALREGASVDDVQRAIINRIVVAHHDMLATYGPEKIMSASEEVAEFHAGAEELGTSDISIMVKEVKDKLQRENPEFPGNRGVGMEEGIGHKILAGAALLAALWGVNINMADDAYENSPQLQQLTKLYQDAEARGDQMKMKEYARRIGDQKTRLDLGYGEVMGKDGHPIQVKEDARDGDPTPEEMAEMNAPVKETDNVAEMAKSDLMNLSKSVEAVMHMLEDSEELPAWCASYITLANDHVESIKEYLAAHRGNDQGESEIVDIDEPDEDREAYDRMHKVFDFSNYKG